MKLECSVEKLKNALSVVEKMTGKNLTLPVLNSILWIVEDKYLKLRATNLNIGIEYNIPSKIESNGIIAVKGDVLLSIFSKLTKESFCKFEKINDNLSIKTKNNSILLKSIPHDDFPTIPQIEGEKFIISSSKFIEGVKSVYYSSSLSEIKPEIGSVYIYPEEDTLVFVSTDSFRLAEKKVKIKQRLSFDGVLIPVKNIIEIIRVFDNLNEDIEITLQKTLISFKSKDIYLASRIVDGNFPDYKQIIPKNNTTEVVVLKQDLLSSLKLSNIFSDKFNQITMNIRVGDKLFEIESKNNEIGENITSIQSAISGEDISVDFNYKYIIDCFQSISTDSLSIKLNGNNKPMIIKPIGDLSFMYLVMPMNR